MEHIQASRCNASYPSSPVFAFNRNVILLEHCTVDSYRFEFIVGGSTLFVDERSCDQHGRLEFVCSKYLQSVFQKSEILASRTAKMVTVRVLSSTGSGWTQEFQFSPIVFWGGISAGFTITDTTEEINLNEQTDLSYFSLAGFETYIRNDLGSFVHIGTNTKTDVASIDVSDYIGRGKQVILKQIKTDRTTFDDTFDYTFIYKVLAEHTAVFNVCQCPNEGAVISWIDNFGFPHTRNFLKGDYSILSSAAGEVLEEPVMQDDSFGFMTSNYQQSYEGKQELALSVPFASMEEWTVLSTILTSPCVQYKAADDRWYQVIVKAGTTVRTSTHLEDFLFTIQLPNLVTQSF